MQLMKSNCIWMCPNSLLSTTQNVLQQNINKQNYGGNDYETLQQNMTFCTHTDNDTQSTHMTGHSLMLIHLSCSCNRGGHTLLAKFTARSKPSTCYIYTMVHNINQGNIVLKTSMHGP